MTEYAYSRNAPCISCSTSMSTIRSVKSSGGGEGVRRAMPPSLPRQPTRPVRRAEAAFVRDLGHLASTSAEAGGATVRRGVPDRDDPDGGAVARDVEGGPECLVSTRWQAEETGSQPGVDRGQQHQQGRQAGVDVPVGDRPAGLVAVGP